MYERERQPSARARPEECLGPGAPGAFSGRGRHAHRTRSCCGSPASDRWPLAGSWPSGRRHVFRGLADLRKLGVVTTRAGGFLTLRGRRLQTTRWTEQLGFWAPEDDVGTHHVVYQVSPGHLSLRRLSRPARGRVAATGEAGGMFRVNRRARKPGRCISRSLPSTFVIISAAVISAR